MSNWNFAAAKMAKRRMILPSPPDSPNIDFSEKMIVKLISGAASRAFAEQVADFYQQPLCETHINRFSDGEMQTVIDESVRGAYVFILQSTFPPAENLFELLLWIDTAKRASAGYITVVMPYFGYARQDRKDKPRVPISAKLVAKMLESAGANRVMTMDVHADQIQGFFDIPVDHLTGESIFFPELAKMDLSKTIFASPDVGGVKRARVYAKHFNAELVICDKQRKKANEIAGMTVIGEVSGADVILVDDLVDTAGTLCKAAEALREKGARSVRAVCTHPVLSGKAYENIENSMLEEILVTDTIPLRQSSAKIRVCTTSKLFAKAIRSTHENRSISALFRE